MVVVVVVEVLLVVDVVVEPDAVEDDVVARQHNKIDQNNLGTGRVAIPTFLRRRPNRKSNGENREQTPPNPFSLHDVDPHLIHQCLGRPTHHSKLQILQFTHFHTATLQTPNWLQWGAPHSPRKIPPPVDRSSNPTTCFIPGPIRPTIPNRASIRDSGILATFKTAFKNLFNSAYTSRH